MKYLKFSDGKEVEIISEDNRFFITKSSQFRKSRYAGNVVEVEEEPKEKKEPAKKSSKKEKEKE